MSQTREEQFKATLLANAAWVSLLTGGTYTDQEVGVEGIHRGDLLPTDRNYSSTAAAFADDGSGELLACAVIRQGSLIPQSGTRNVTQKFTGTVQRVEIFFYQFRQCDIINQAKDLSYQILEGSRFSDPACYPIYWEGDSPYFYDVGPVANATVLRQTWVVPAMKKV